MRARLRDERGTVLATTMILLSLMTMGGLATYAYVDGQTLESGRERVRETTFNVGEGLLGAQVFTLSRDWPGKGGEAYPTCPSAGTKCPDGAALVSAFGGPDVAKGVTWQTRVLDNKLDDSRLAGLPADSTARCAAASRATPSYYDDASMTAAPTIGRDANDDCRMWVRAQAAIDGRRRTFVGLVRVDQITEEFPRNTITAGKVSTGNNGNKELIDTDGPNNDLQPGPVAVRCDPAAAGCVHIGKDNQISPAVIERYPDQPALTPEALQRLTERAEALGTHYSSYTGCDMRLAGPLVVIETANIVCTGNLQLNAPPALPGILIVKRGTIEFGGTTAFYGIVHHANLPPSSSDWLVRTSGTGLIKGSISVDGPGGVYVNASSNNVVYDTGPFSRVVSFGNAGIIQNTWREIVPAAGA